MAGSCRDLAHRRTAGGSTCESFAPWPSPQTIPSKSLAPLVSVASAMVLFPIYDPTTRTAAAPHGLSRSEGSRSATNPIAHRTAWRVHGIHSFQSGDRMWKRRDRGLSNAASPKGGPRMRGQLALAFRWAAWDLLGCCPSTPTVYGPIDTGTSIRIVCYIMNRIGVVARGCRGSLTRGGGWQLSGARQRRHSST
jgi:hypothetical protein